MLQSQIILEEQLFRLYALGVWFPSDSLPPSLDPDEQRGLRWMAPKLPEGLHNLRLLRPSPCLSSISRISKTPFGGRQTYGCWSCWSKTSPSDQWDTGTPNEKVMSLQTVRLTINPMVILVCARHDRGRNTKVPPAFDHRATQCSMHPRSIIRKPSKTSFGTHERQWNRMISCEFTKRRGNFISGPVAALTLTHPVWGSRPSWCDPSRSAPAPPLASWCFVRGASGRNWAAGVASSLGSPGSKGLGSYNHWISGTWWICYGFLWDMMGICCNYRYNQW